MIQQSSWYQNWSYRTQNMKRICRLDAWLDVTGRILQMSTKSPQPIIVAEICFLSKLLIYSCGIISFLWAFEHLYWQSGSHEGGLCICTYYLKARSIKYSWRRHCWRHWLLKLAISLSAVCQRGTTGNPFWAGGLHMLWNNVEKPCSMHNTHNTHNTRFQLNVC